MSSKANKGKLIYHDEVKKYTNDGKVKSAEDMVVHHAEDGYYAKYFKKAGGKSTKIEVKAGGAGGEYTLMVTKDGGEKKTSTHNKTEITAFLKKNADLQFMLDYLVNNKSLARAKRTATKRKTASKGKKKTTSKSKGKKKTASKSKGKKKTASKSKGKKKSKSKSKSKSKGKRKTASKSKAAKRTGGKRKAASKSKGRKGGRRK